MSKKVPYSADDLINNNLSNKEFDHFCDHFLDPGFEFEIKHTMLQHLDGMEEQESVDLNKLYRGVKKRIDRPQKRMFPIRPMQVADWLKIAAIVVVSVLTGALGDSLFQSGNVDYHTVVSAGESSVTKTTLPDGTTLFLNSGSELTYNPSKWDDKRLVSLKGEAWFHVEQDEQDGKKPFVVRTAYYNVKVTGTKFNVKAYDDEKDIVTTLEEGQVIIESGSKLKLSQNIVLSPGQQVRFNRDEKVVDVKDVSAGLYSSWKDHQLIFVNTNLKNMLKDFERKYGVKIKVLDDEILNLHYYGTFENESIIDVLTLLSQTLPIKFSIEGQVVVIQKIK